jgi:predicted nuclease of predicted toxin-antitoxin system
MRFVVDESTGLSIYGYLIREGHDAIFVGDQMQQSDDANILEFAFRENRVLVTNDKDFGELVFRGGHAHKGILLLRPQAESQEQRLKLISNVLIHHADRLEDNFCVATERSFRIRAKP